MIDEALTDIAVGNDGLGGIHTSVCIPASILDAHALPLPSKRQPPQIKL